MNTKLERRAFRNISNKLVMNYLCAIFFLFICRRIPIHLFVCSWSIQFYSLADTYSEIWNIYCFSAVTMIAIAPPYYVIRTLTVLYRIRNMKVIWRDTDFWFWGFFTVCKVHFLTTFRESLWVPSLMVTSWTCQDIYLTHRAKSPEPKISIHSTVKV
jgi:hypothetical protein